MAKLERSNHECKPDLPAGAAGAVNNSARSRPTCRVGNGERTPEPREDRCSSVHLFINQAGQHLELRISAVESGGHRQLQKR